MFVFYVTAFQSPALNGRNHVLSLLSQDYHSPDENAIQYLAWSRPDTIYFFAELDTNVFEESNG